MSPRAVGVDGCPGGWIVAAVTGRRVRWLVGTDIAAVLGAHPGDVVAVDMPIGLLDAPGRPAETEARAWLAAHGGPRSSIFASPTRAVLTDHEDGRSHA